MSPFCTRRDVTPHHVTFRAHGGDDSEENLVTLCTWCHLEGVHRGRFTVTRENGVLVWRFGNHTVVVGRRRIRALPSFRGGASAPPGRPSEGSPRGASMSTTCRA